jgi:hypothetical protein
VPLDHGLSVVVTRRADHTPHTTVVNAGVLARPLTGSDTVAFVAAGGSRKLATCAATPPLLSSSEPAGSGPPSKAPRS